MRLIDADALRISALDATKSSEFAFDHCFPYWQFSKCIKEAPTIGTVKHGKWIDTDFCNTTGEIYECSACHKFYNPDKKAVMQSRQKENPDFCPTCGAHMIGGDNNG